MDKWKEECHVDEVFDDVMGQKVEIHMKDLLACSKPFWDLMFKGSAKDEKGTESVAPMVLVNGLALSEWSYVASMLKIKVKMGNVSIDAMLNTSAEVNIMSKALADRAGLMVRTNVQMGMKAVLGGLSKFMGMCEDVEVNIGGLVNLQTILVVLFITQHKLILGQPFVHDVQVCPYFDDEG